MSPTLTRTLTLTLLPNPNPSPKADAHPDQEGQIAEMRSEMREIVRASEARQQALLERLALQTRALDEAQAELGALRRVAAEVRTSKVSK